MKTASLESHQLANVAHAVGQWSERIAWPILLTGVMVRLTVRDRVPFLSAAYYATPTVILGALALILMFWHLARKDKRLASLAAIVAAVSIIATVQSNFRWTPQPKTWHGNRIVLWNMRNFASGWSGPTGKLRDMQPDIAGIVEGGWNALAGEWQDTFPEYTFSRLQHGLAIMARGEISDEEQGALGPHGRYLSAKVACEETSYRVVLVDLLSSPTVSRRPALVQLKRLTERYADEPLLVMGDFNTPRDSTHFNLLEQQLTHAFTAAGCGYAATWPFPLPVLDLDHVWFNDQIELSNCQHGCTFQSDHRPVMIECRAKGHR